MVRIFARALLASSALLLASHAVHAQAASAWPAGDQRGMANTLGPSTWARCAPHLANPAARSYELSHLRSNTMPQSPFGMLLVDKYRPTVGIPGTRHAFNGEETVSGEPGAQGTQLDALGHFAVTARSSGTARGSHPSNRAAYYGGYTQSEVKPDTGFTAAEARRRESAADRDDGGAARRQGLSRRRARRCSRAQLVTAADIEAMLKGQGLAGRGLQRGDVLYIYTGWGEIGRTRIRRRGYYTKGPGLAVDGAKSISGESIGCGDCSRQPIYRPCQ